MLVKILKVTVMTQTRIRTVSELVKLKTFDERYEYLRLNGIVGESTFGFDRYINQMLYGSQQWSQTRDSVIIRDNGCDLGMDGYEIKGRIYIHHINPISQDDIVNITDKVFNLDFLICTSHNTHLAIHYGNKSLLPQLPIQRYPGDTCLWR
jgi:hypothetical protein